MKLGVLGIVGLLLLTGCASSPSLEDQASLIEYEKCLDHETQVSNLVRSSTTRENPFINSDVTQYVYLYGTFASVLEKCASYRP